jgi:hypothetical protein
VSRQGLEALRARVHGDPELARGLRRLAPERFEAELLRLAAERGDDVTPQDVGEARARARRDWMLRWVR